jgi:hypothetical protein
MAVQPGTLVSSPDIHIRRIKWLTLANGDTGAPIRMSNFQDRTVQVVGTFGVTGSVTIQGSNDDGATWATLTDPLGNALTFTAAGIKQITELPLDIRPIVTAGDVTTALAVWLHMRGANK